jgi:uncharacterized protein (DUF1778 family)
MASNSAETFQPSRTARLEARITEERKNRLQRAAALTGRSLSDFTVTSVQEAAMRTIHDYELIRVTGDERNVFVKPLLNPPAPRERLQKSVKTYE